MNKLSREVGSPRLPLSDGAVASETILPSGRGQTWVLDEFRGKPVVVVFCPADREGQVIIVDGGAAVA
jgi:hypothetical protein